MLVVDGEGEMCHCAGITSSPAAPEISNVRVSQPPGTTLVDVYYNLAGSTDSGASVSVELSDNSGASFGLPVSALSGHVGASITNGTNRHLIWNAKADRPDGYSATMRLRFTAVDTLPDITRRLISSSVSRLPMWRSGLS